MTLLLQGAGLQTTTSAPSGPTPLLDLEADTLALSDGDPVATWANVGSLGSTFAQSTPAFMPIFRSGGGIPYLEFASGGNVYLFSNSSLIAPLDNPSSYTAIGVWTFATADAYDSVLSKMDWDIGGGWSNETDYAMAISMDYSNSIGSQSRNAPYDNTKRVCTFEMISTTEVHIYINGVLDDGLFGYGTITTITSGVIPIQIGTSAPGSYGGFRLYCVRFYSPALNAIDRAAVEAEIAARYGVTL